MTFWIVHVLSAITLGLFLILLDYILRGDIFWGLVLTFGLLLAQFIDLDHYRGSTTQLFRGAKATNQKEYKNIYPEDTPNPLHNLFIINLITYMGAGFIIGLWLHTALDGWFIK